MWFDSSYRDMRFKNPKLRELHNKVQSGEITADQAAKLMMMSIREGSTGTKHNNQKRTDS